MRSESTKAIIISSHFSADGSSEEYLVEGLGGFNSGHLNDLANDHNKELAKQGAFVVYSEMAPSDTQYNLIRPYAGEMVEKEEAKGLIAKPEESN